MYRNYDAQGSTFGETSIRVSVPDPDQLSAFAAERSSDRALTLMVVNKVLTGNTPVEIQFTNVHTYSAAQAWQLTSMNTIDHLPDIPLGSNMLSNALPAQSITLFIVPTTEAVSRWFVGPNRPAGELEIRLEGMPGKYYSVETSSDLNSWTLHSTELMSQAGVRILVPTTNSARFFRAWSDP
jgi:hypothetical protein